MIVSTLSRTHYDSATYYRYPKSDEPGRGRGETEKENQIERQREREEDCENGGNLREKETGRVAAIRIKEKKRNKLRYLSKRTTFRLLLAVYKSIN